MNINTLDSLTLHSPQSIPSRFTPEVLLYEQRYLPRWQVNLKAFYRVKDTVTIAKTQLKDLNINGVCLHVAEEDVHPGDQLELKIYLSDRMSFQAQGIIIWKRGLPEGRYYAGVLLDVLPEEAQDLILEYAFGMNDLLGLPK